MGTDDVSRATARANVWDRTANSGSIDCIIDAGETVPTDGDAGWYPGALFFDTNASDNNSYWYMNTGTAASCNFDVLQMATVREDYQTLGSGSTTPTDGTAGWEANALFVYTGGANSADRLWTNTNTSSACTFEAITHTMT